MRTISYIELSASDFDNCDWQSVVENATEKDCDEYYKLFFEMASEAAEAGNQKCAEIFTILGGICSMRLIPDSEDGFEPIFFSRYARGFMLDDLKEQHLVTLSELVPSIRDAELRARIADVVWTKGRSPYFSMVPIAVQAYMGSATTLLQPEEHVLNSDTVYSQKSVERFQRSISLASLTNQRELSTQIISLIDNIVQDHDKADSKFPFIGLIQIILSLPESHGIETNRYAAICEELAERAENRSDWLIAARYWSFKAGFDSKNGDSEEWRGAQIRCAEAYVKFAEIYATAEPPNYAAASFQLRHAIEIYRNIGGMKFRYKELLDQIVRYEQLFTYDWERESFHFDVDEIPQKVRAEFRGKPWQEAILELAMILPGTDVKRLRESVEEYFSQSTFQNLFAVNIVDYRGRTIDTSPALMGATEEEKTKALANRMFQEARLYYSVRSTAVIAPAIEQIRQDNYVRLSDWLFLVENNGFVPNDRVYLYMKGLHAGFNGDFIVSAHILIPQLENSLRYVLEQKGVQPYSLDTRTGVREAHTLETILGNETLLQTLGEGTIFDLKTLLIRRFGENYRNDLAHGLLTTGRFSSHSFLYLWWLVLNLCFRGVPRGTIIQSEED